MKKIITLVLTFWLLGQWLGFAHPVLSWSPNGGIARALQLAKIQTGTFGYDVGSDSNTAYDLALPSTTTSISAHLNEARQKPLAYDADPVYIFLENVSPRCPAVGRDGFFAAEGAGARLALPGVRQVDYSWGALNTYREGGQMTALEHINYRHAFESGFSDVSRFAEGTSVRDIQSFVDQASRYGNVTAQGANAFKIEYNLGRTIGTGQAGEAASENGQVQTAFPIALP